MTKEYWHRDFASIIPHDAYFMQLHHSDQQGLVLTLSGKANTVTLDFGIIHAVNILDEGVQLNAPPGFPFENRDELHTAGFPDTIYRVENGAYAAYLKSMMTSELYESYGLRQYNIVTQNHVAEVICSEEPIIHIR